MTYKEAYMKCNTYEELVETMKQDFITAQLFTPSGKERKEKIEKLLPRFVKLKDGKKRGKLKLFEVGDTVSIKPYGSYRGRFSNMSGTVINSGRSSIGVKFDGITNEKSKYGCYWFPKNELIKNITNNKGDLHMSEITGYNKVASVGMGGQTYYFALFDDDVKAGDKVVVSGSASGQVQTVKDVISKADSEKLYGGKICAEVVCKVNTTKYDERIIKRKEAASLKAEMNKKVKELQDVALFELMAEKSPELKEMLDRYKELSA